MATAPARIPQTTNTETPVETTPEFDTWFDGLTKKDKGSVVSAVKALRIEGVKLGFPLSSQIEGRYRELRCGATRVFYAFDSERKAVLLTGGEKNDKSLYGAIVATAKKLFERWEEKLQESREAKSEKTRANEKKSKKK